MRKRQPKPCWSDSPEAHIAYRQVRAEVQKQCNEDGFDRGIEANDLMKYWHTFMLPGKSYRCGYELHCEVVSCEIIDRCQPGHGPMAVDTRPRIV